MAAAQNETRTFGLMAVTRTYAEMWYEDANVPKYCVCEILCVICSCWQRRCGIQGHAHEITCLRHKACATVQKEKEFSESQHHYLYVNFIIRLTTCFGPFAGSSSGHNVQHHHNHHHHHVPEGLGVFPVPWPSRWSWSLHLFLGRPMFLRPFGLYCSTCFGSLFVSILCTCCSHFFWYCFISFTVFCVLSPIHWFLSLSSFFIPVKIYKEEKLYIVSHKI